MITQVEFNKKSENPFYGMKNTLGIFQAGSKGTPITRKQLNDAVNECKNEMQLAVLLSVLFSIGDITGRQHNIFESKVESGGNAQREIFRDNIVPYLVDYFTIKGFNIQRLMTLITEYTTMDNILALRVKTAKKTQNVERVINMISVFGLDNVVDYCARIVLKGTEFQKMCMSKFIGRPVFSKRKGHSKLLEETKSVMKLKAEFLKKLSGKCSFAYEEKDKYVDFKGFYAWRKPYIKDTEAVLFATGTIMKLDREEFFKFLETMPSDARFRVKKRILQFNESKELKYPKLNKWYAEWEKYKEDMQAEQRKLESQLEDGEMSVEIAEKLKDIKKKAKVNVGATNFQEMFAQIITGTIDKVKIQPFLDRVNLPYNSLVIMDSSGSMSWGGGRSEPYLPYQFAAFLATICLMKNPDADARDFIGLFDSRAQLVSHVREIGSAPNSLMVGSVNVTSPIPLINKSKHFLDNLKRMNSILYPACRGGSTNISSIPDGFHAWSQGDSEKIEQLQKYPIWTIISDGEFNNMHSPESSLNDFMRRCENYFGFRPYVILIDVASRAYGRRTDITRFSGIDNVMMIPPNPAQIEMFLTNFKDMDVYDVYTPLLSLSRSKRYAPIRDYVIYESHIEDEVPQEKESV